MLLEKEVFPFMARDGQLFAFDQEGTSSVKLLYLLYLQVGFYHELKKEHRNVNGRGMYVRVIANTTVC